MSRIALTGAAPAVSRPFPSWPRHGQEEREALLRVLASGRWWMGDGEEVLSLEREFAEYHKTRHAVAVTNGTHSLEMILTGLGGWLWRRSHYPRLHIHRHRHCRALRQCHSHPRGHRAGHFLPGSGSSGGGYHARHPSDYSRLRRGKHRAHSSIEGGRGQTPRSYHRRRRAVAR